MTQKKNVRSGSNHTLIRMLSEIIWDADYRSIDLERDKFPIIERALMYGREEHIRWVYRQYSEQDIAHVVRLSSNIDRRTASYWSIRLQIPQEEIRCFSKSSALS